MHRILKPIFACSAAVFLAIGAPAIAQQMGAVKPLVVIRFNQPRVYYDQQLYGAISQAVAIKPEVTFSVLAYAPATGDSDKDSQWQQAASGHTQQVVASMQQMGIPLDRIRVTGQSQPGLRYDETHVFVQ